MRQMRQYNGGVSQIDDTMITKGFNKVYMHSTDKQIQSFKELWRKEYGQELTNAEALEYSTNLIGFFRTLLEIDNKVRQWNEKLITEPKGFPFPESGSYNCNVCHQQISNKQGWYDQFGIKCQLCQKAVEDGVITGSVCTDKQSWFSTDNLKSEFGWHYSTVSKKIRTGELKARIVKTRNGADYFYVFLKEENKLLI